MPLLLISAVTCLLLWMVLTFVASLTTGVIHLLLAMGSTLLVAWWALRA